MRGQPGRCLGHLMVLGTLLVLPATVLHQTEASTADDEVVSHDKLALYSLEPAK